MMRSSPARPAVPGTRRRRTRHTLQGSRRQCRATPKRRTRYAPGTVKVCCQGLTNGGRGPLSPIARAPCNKIRAVEFSTRCCTGSIHPPSETMSTRHPCRAPPELSAAEHWRARISAGRSWSRRWPSREERPRSATQPPGDNQPRAVSTQGELPRGARLVADLSSRAGGAPRWRTLGRRTR